jgi:acyl-CoA thioesterase
MTPKERAEKSAQVLWENDAASRWLGVELAHVDAGTATMWLDVQKRHLNGHGICHGGFIYALADCAFAFASNSYNRVAVAHNNSITYLSPGQNGERLTAVAREVGLAGRSGIYDVVVTAPDDRVIAQFRGGSRIVKGQLFEEET